MAHAEKLRTDLLGIDQVQAENCQIWKGKVPVHIPRDFSTLMPPKPHPGVKDPVLQVDDPG